MTSSASSQPALACPDLVLRTKRSGLYDFVAERLADIEEYVGAAQHHIAVHDLPGLTHDLHAAKAHMKCALEAEIELRRLMKPEAQ